ncbi:MAG: UDP-N-acetylmuramate--L-alanine ligase [Halobacteriovoraceae bacterium]|nr:UDP-N-acetylmuramate--L-alanine ligase [Halobacteriovoraceae bacterium]
MIDTRKDISIHFIGIGGIGMSGIAEVLVNLGYKVTGSDISDSANTNKLQSLGATIFIGHDEKNIQDQTVVVYSSAIDNTNPEINKARNLKIPIMRRAEMLAELMRLKYGIAIAGTHGKTTTTSMLATILKEANKDPTYIIGGIVKNLKGHANVGKGDYLVAEADESDGSFLLLNPIMSVITNIDKDHLDHYGSVENLHESFLKFANKVPFYGVCAINAHDPELINMRSEIIKPTITFGINTDSDYIAKEVVQTKDSCAFKLFYQNEYQCDFKINLPGEHNVLNALGALALAHSMNIDFKTISLGLSKFEGVGRRMQTVYKYKNFEVIDDYAHHPTEILKTLKTLKDTRKNQKIMAIFEPHRFSRTKSCWNEFLHSFNYVDKVGILPIYPASEAPIEGILSGRLVKDINGLHPNLAEELQGYSNIRKYILDNKEENATLIVLGAGPISRKTSEIVTKLNE